MGSAENCNLRFTTVEIHMQVPKGQGKEITIIDGKGSWEVC